MSKREHDLQSACVRWFRFQHPDLALFAIPNGAFLAGSDPSKRAIQWKKLRAEGALEGAADLFLAARTKDSAGLFIEMKVKGNKQTENQKKFEIMVKNAGYYYIICRDFDTFVSTIQGYLDLAI